MGRQEAGPGGTATGWPPPAGQACLTELQALAHAAGEESLSRLPAIAEHVDRCARCQTLVAEAARALNEGLPGSAERGLLQTLRPGELVLGRYEVLRFVGCGGMGEVYEARDGHLGTTLALKTLALPALDDPEAVLRLKREVLLARRATHANVCRIFDFGVYARTGAGGAEEIPFLTMELLQGQTLAQRLRAGPLAPAEAQPIVVQILTGLRAVHRAGIVHRDLKPENVVLVPEPGQSAPRVVLMDFGLARSALSARTLTHPGAVVGTVGYMAPEQLEGRAATPASDLYALGVVLFEMLVGRRPFSRELPPAVALERVSGLPPSWAPGILRCLEPDAADRFSSVEELRAALFGARAPRSRLERVAFGVAGAAALAGLAWLGWSAHPAAERAAPALAPLSPAPVTVAPPPVVEPAPAPIPPAPASEARRRPVRPPRPREATPLKETVSAPAPVTAAPAAAPPAAMVPAPAVEAPAAAAPPPPSPRRTVEKW